MYIYFMFNGNNNLKLLPLNLDCCNNVLIHVAEPTELLRARTLGNQTAGNESYTAVGAGSNLRRTAGIWQCKSQYICHVL
jgi:hypothetical protein